MNKPLSRKLLFFTGLLFSVSFFYFSFYYLKQDDVKVISKITPAAFKSTIASAVHINPDSFIDIPVASAATFEVGKPLRLIIPAISVNANVEHLGLTSEGAVAAPEGAKDVSWFNIGPRPGQKGSAVISGHYGRWKNGTDSVFNLLPNLKIGDDIYVKDDNGITRSFTVKKVNVYDKNETVPEIFNKSDKSYLNIITCHGKYIESEQTYSQRLIVFAQLNP